jgi:hypothetical protein
MEGLKDKEDEEDDKEGEEERGGTATIEVQTAAARSGEEISLALSASRSPSILTMSKWPSLLASISAVYPSFKGKRRERERVRGGEPAATSAKENG